MGDSAGGQPDPQEIELHGWLRYHSAGHVRLGRAIGEQRATFWVLRAVGQPFANQHRVCVLGEEEGAHLKEELDANGGNPFPATVRGILFSLQPGVDVYLVAVKNGIRHHASDGQLAEFVATRQAVERMVLEELARIEQASRSSGTEMPYAASADSAHLAEVIDEAGSAGSRTD